jgi:hypothetical protein
MKPWLYHLGPKAHIHWNLECSVGKGGQNSLACDVSYIQWYYSLAASHPNTPLERKVVYGKVAVNGICTGTASDPLVQAILVHQAALKHKTMDGKISVATGDGRVGGTPFFILRLNSRLAHMHPNLWPRLDLIPGCPALVADAVRACIPIVQEPIA